MAVTYIYFVVLQDMRVQIQVPEKAQVNVMIEVARYQFFCQSHTHVDNLVWLLLSLGNV